MLDHAPAPKLLIDAHAAAEALDISARSLWSVTAPRGDVPCVRIGRAIRYSPANLERWIGARRTCQGVRP